MSHRFKLRGALLPLSPQSSFVWNAVADRDDVLHILPGVVKPVDKGTKTVVIKASDGTEHKYTEKTAVEDTKGASKGVEKGAADT